MTAELTNAIEPEHARSLEAALLALVPEHASASPVFVVGSPRTGSTMLFQLLVLRLGLPFVANVTNDLLWSTPIVGLALQRGVRPGYSLESSYGKTRGPFAPSEASAVMGTWCGGGHPSQTCSAKVLEGRKAHMCRTMAGVEMLYDGLPMVIKNAWNCFRIRSLAETLPNSRFIWIRRDARHAAASDLAARRVTKGSETSWNSATPANLEELRRMSPEVQVLENQYEFNRAIEDGLSAVAPGRSEEVWYEDILVRPEECLARISAMLGRTGVSSNVAMSPDGIRPGSPVAEDLARIDRHLALHRERFARYLRQDPGSSPCVG